MSFTVQGVREIETFEDLSRAQRIIFQDALIEAHKEGRISSAEFNRLMENLYVDALEDVNRLDDPERVKETFDPDMEIEEEDYESPGRLPAELKDLALSLGGQGKIWKLQGEKIEFTLAGKKVIRPLGLQTIRAMISYLKEARRQPYYVMSNWGIKRAMPTPATEGVQNREFYLSTRGEKDKIIHLVVLARIPGKRGIVIYPEREDISELGPPEYCQFKEISRNLMELAEVPDRKVIELPARNVWFLWWLKEENERAFKRALKKVDEFTIGRDLWKFDQYLRKRHFGDGVFKIPYMDDKGKERIQKIPWIWEKRTVHGEKVKAKVIRPALTFEQFNYVRYAITERLSELETISYKRLMAGITNPNLRKGIQEAHEKQMKRRWTFWDSPKGKELLQKLEKAEPWVVKK